jgi:alanyl-tRNA synthetase
VGDTGWIDTGTGSATVIDTTLALPGLYRHLGVVTAGTVDPGQEATARIDSDKRAATRRNHTGTHLLHWALREVLGDHVKQAGSLVAPDRLRFDFTHYEPMTPAEIARVEDLVNEQVLADAPVRVTVMGKEDADQRGAIAFFGEKYGEKVRVVEAGDRSLELCGGTHVTALGQIGPVKIVQEGSIGANLRRIEATTGTLTLQRLRHDEEVIAQAADLLKVRPDELAPAIERRLEDLRQAGLELRAVRQVAQRERAHQLAATAAADGGVVVAREDGLDQKELRELATSIRAESGVRAVVLGGTPAEGKVALVAAVPKGADLVAWELIAEAATIVGGGVGKQAEVAMAGGKNPARLDEALQAVRQKLGLEPR